MAQMFRLLRADEIECRIGQTKAGKGVSLLLYKDARCDQNILDKTVGPMNWMRQHDRDNANCIVSIYDEKKCQWISKEDTGTESKTEAEKGLASDSFKRACVNWGIGRELYSAPFIWISGDPDKLKYEKFSVAEIGYDEMEEINALSIADKNGNIVYRFGNTKAKYMPPMKTTVPDDAMDPGEKIDAPAWNARIARGAWCVENGISQKDFATIQATLESRNNAKYQNFDVISEDQFRALCNDVKQMIPEYKKWAEENGCAR